MNAIRLHIANDPEAGSALALYLTAAGYEVEADFVDGSVFVSADAIDPDVEIEDGEQLAFALRCRLDDVPTELECTEISNDFRYPAA
jgi:hypothetical protein